MFYYCDMSNPKDNTNPTMTYFVEVASSPSTFVSLGLTIIMENWKLWSKQMQPCSKKVGVLSCNVNKKRMQIFESYI